ISYAFAIHNRIKAGNKRDFFLDLDLIAWTFILPSILQLVLWPNFQIRLLLPHGFLLSAMLTFSFWRLAQVSRPVMRLSAHGNFTGQGTCATPRRALRITANATLALGALCTIPYTMFAF